MPSKPRPTPTRRPRPPSKPVRSRTAKMGDALPLSEVRARLSPLIKQMRPQGRPLGITVHGKVEAYLLTREQLDRMLSSARQEGRAKAKRPTLRGSIKLMRSLDEGSAEASRMLLDSAARTAEELTRG